MKHVMDKRDSVRAVDNNRQLVSVVYQPLILLLTSLFEELSRGSVVSFHSISKKQFPRSCEFAF